MVPLVLCRRIPPLTTLPRLTLTQLDRSDTKHSHNDRLRSPSPQGAPSRFLGGRSLTPFYHINFSEHLSVRKLCNFHVRVFTDMLFLHSVARPFLTSTFSFLSNSISHSNSPRPPPHPAPEEGRTSLPPLSFFRQPQLRRLVISSYPSILLRSTLWNANPAFDFVQLLAIFAPCFFKPGLRHTNHPSLFDTFTPFCRANLDDGLAPPGAFLSYQTTNSGQEKDE